MSQQTMTPPLCIAITSTTQPTSTSSTSSELKIGTYNVFFDIGNYKQRSCSVQRYKKQFEIFQKHQLDVLFLNEVTHNYVQLLLQDAFIVSNYFVFIDPAVATAQNDNYFGNVALCKMQPTASYMLSWSDTTIKHRPGMVLVFDKLVLVGAHFKAYNDQFKVRQAQMKEACAVLDYYAPSSDGILLGDLNFESNMEECLIRNDFVDMWTALRKDDEGCTFDGTKNGTVQFVHGSSIWKKRLDRILVKQPCTWQCTSIDMFAQEHVFSGVEDPQLPNKKQAMLHPSDHFGLVMHMKK